MAETLTADEQVLLLMASEVMVKLARPAGEGRRVTV